MDKQCEDFLHLIGLALRASCLSPGEEPVAAAAQAGTARLLLLAEDAADNSVRRARRFTENTHCTVLSVPFTKTELGGALGRATCAMMVITEAGFAASAAEKLSAIDPERFGEASLSLSETARRVRQRKAPKKSRRRRKQ